MKYHFEYLPYRRNFLRPLMTSHGEWSHREGIIIRLENEEGSYGFGEIAPLPSFGTETFGSALAWCREIVDLHVFHPFDMIPGELPCCQWAVSSAWKAFEGEFLQRKLPVAALVDSPQNLQEMQHQGFQTFKVKIGIKDPLTEFSLVESYFDLLQSGQRIRLDGNGGLSESAYAAWLEFLEGKAIEYLEQPLSPGLENRMLEMAEPFSTSIALDESLAGMESLQKWKNWPGPLVVKPSLLGWAKGPVPAGLIGSSVFETAFGFEAGLRFCSRHQKADTAIGFGINSYLEEDGWSLHGSGNHFAAGAICLADLQALWDKKR